MRPLVHPVTSRRRSGQSRMEPFRWRRALFLGLVSYAASLAGLVFDTFVPVLLQAGHPLWHNTMGLHAPLVGFALAPSLAFFIMTWDNLINVVVHPWAGVRSDTTWTRWGRRKPWILVGVPLAVTGLLTIPLARTLASVMLAILVTNLGRALFVPPMVAWYRSRNAGYPAPPAQFRTCGFPSSGSYLGCVTAKRASGQGWRMRGCGSHRRARRSTRSQVIRSRWL